MEDCSFHSYNEPLHVQYSGRKDENITIAISENEIALQDHQEGSVTVFQHTPERNFTLETGKGNDIIHIVSKGDLLKPCSINIIKKEGHKFIIGSPDPMVHINLDHSNEQDLVLPDDQPATYEYYEKKIRQWNENNRKKDGLFKNIKRKLVYLFGRDLRFKRPFPFENRMRKWLNRVKLFKVDASTAATEYFTTREHIDQLEKIARPGDILLRYQEGYPFDKYLVGTWQHAGLYFKKGLVVDAMGNGTYLRTMNEFGKADGIVLIRIEHISERQVQLALSYAFEQIGKSYSVDFDDGFTEQYCSGLVVNAYKYSGTLGSGYMQHEAIHPDDLLRLPNSRILWTNRKDLLDKVYLAEKNSGSPVPGFPKTTASSLVSR